MCSEDSARLTRVVGDQCEMEMTRLPDVIHKIQGSLHGIPKSHRDYIANALLNLAVSRMTATEGASQTVSFLMRSSGADVDGDSASPPK